MDIGQINAVHLSEGHRADGLLVKGLCQVTLEAMVSLSILSFNIISLLNINEINNWMEPMLSFDHSGFRERCHLIIAYSSWYGHE